jgi:hypothetical protein
MWEPQRVTTLWAFTGIVLPFYCNLWQSSLSGITNSMEHRPTVRESPCLLWNLKVNYRVQRRPPLVLILEQMNPVPRYALCLYHSFQRYSPNCAWAYPSETSDLPSSKFHVRFPMFRSFQRTPSSQRPYVECCKMLFLTMRNCCPPTKTTDIIGAIKERG